MSVLMCVCAPVLSQVMEGCTVEENSGEIPVASLAHVRKYMILCTCNILSKSLNTYLYILSYRLFSNCVCGYNNDLCMSVHVKLMMMIVKVADTSCGLWFNCSKCL